MHKLLLIIVLTALSICQIYSQEVKQEQRTLVTKRTATWCPYCGSWGWNMMTGLLEDNDEKSIIWAAHYSGDLVNSTSESIVQNIGGAGQPRFYLNQTDKNVTSSNVSSKRTAIKDEIEQTFTQMPDANAGIRATKTGRRLNMDVKAKFFNQSQGEYYLAVYVIEDDVLAYQAGKGANTPHKNVLREAVTSEKFGVLVASGVITAGTEYTTSYTYDVPSNWEVSNVSLAAVLWKKQNNKYQFVNGYVIDDIQESTGTSAEDVMKTVSLDLNVLPNMIYDNAEVRVALGKKYRNVKVSLFDLMGKEVHQLYEGSLESGINSFELRKQHVPYRGMYLVVLEADHHQISKRVVFK